MARSTTATRRYAEAAFQIASRDKTLDDWAVGLELAGRIVSDARVAAVVDNPARPLRDRTAALEKLLKGRVPEGVLRLAGLLAERNRVERLPGVATEFRRLLDRQRGIVEARVTSAAPLTPDETDAVRGWVERTTGAKVNLTASVDEALIGGLTVRVGDTLMDASVRGRLERLRNQLASGARVG